MTTTKLTLLACTAAIAFAPVAYADTRVEQPRAAYDEAAPTVTLPGEAAPSPDAPAATSEPMGEMTDRSGTVASDVLVRIDQPDAPVPALDRTVSDIEGMTVVGSDRETLGKVGSVIGNSDGTPTALTVDSGGFLGIGEKTIAVQLDRFMVVDGDRLALAMTRDQIDALPEWEAPRTAE